MIFLTKLILIFNERDIITFKYKKDIFKNIQDICEIFLENRFQGLK